MAMQTERAVLAGGCFWGMQGLIRKMPGVIATRVGYTGGDVLNATYHNHGTHAEAIGSLRNFRDGETRRQRRSAPSWGSCPKVARREPRRIGETARGAVNDFRDHGECLYGAGAHARREKQLREILGCALDRRR
jgi:hypothetical protein